MRYIEDVTVDYNVYTTTFTLRTTGILTSEQRQNMGKNGGYSQRQRHMNEIHQLQNLIMQLQSYL